MASANWMNATTHKAGAMKKHLGQQERENGNHSNPDIDKALTPNNYTIGCNSFTEALERMKERTKEVDEVKPPKRVKKDRVTCCFIEIPCPDVLTQQGRADEFFQQAFKVMQGYFGDKNVHGGFVHKDERHEYTDKDGSRKMSLEHMHTLVSAYTEEKGINGKAFETKARLRAFNKELDDMCVREFGIKYNTGEKPEHKSVERLKEETALRAEADRLKAEINQTLLNSVPPYEPKPYPEKPSLPEEYQDQNEPINGYPDYSWRYKQTEKKREKWKKGRSKEQARIDEQYRQDFTAVDHENELSRQAWDSKYMTADNLAKVAQEQSVKAQELAEREQAVSRKERQVEQAQRQVEQKVQALFDNRVQEMFGSVPTKREQRLEDFCSDLKLKDGTTALERFEQQEKQLRKGQFRGR